MARRVFFSFHYQNDIFRVNQIRNSHVVEGCAAAGFQDASLWEEAKRKGDAAIKSLVDQGLINTSVTVVLIGEETAQRRYVTYEIEQSLAIGNGLLGIHIHNIKNRDGRMSLFPGRVPAALLKAGAPVYTWDRNLFSSWVEEAFQRSQQKKSYPWGF
jgi:antiphage defense system Thoeris ThsB-like protein